MKYLFSPILFFLLLKNFAFAQQIYSQAYGNPKDPAIIFVHGGPRGNATLFEGSTASLLAEKGFYVIVYDRRGEGRSQNTVASMTFTEAFADMDKLIEKYKVKKVSIIGHSFGGLVSTLYTHARPQNVERLILVGALFSQQETYDHILKSTAKIAVEKGDTESLQNISAIDKLDRSSADYRKKCYEVASKYGYFDMPSPTPESQQLRLRYQNSEFGKNNIRNDQAPLLFYKNEKKVNIDTKPLLIAIKKMQVKIFGIYGKDDGIFSSKQISDLILITGSKHFDLIENCSHYPFVDQQKLFIADIVKFMHAS